MICTCTSDKSSNRSRSLPIDDYFGRAHHISNQFDLEEFYSIQFAYFCRSQSVCIVEPSAIFYEVSFSYFPSSRPLACEVWAWLVFGSSVLGRSHTTRVRSGAGLQQSVAQRRSTTLDATRNQSSLLIDQFGAGALLRLFSVFIFARQLWVWHRHRLTQPYDEQFVHYRIAAMINRNEYTTVMRCIHGD